MTKKERHDSLKLMWQKMPVNRWGCDDTKFVSWQGAVTALLNYNSTLQSEFRETVKSYRPKMHSLAEPMHTQICTILSQAINELMMPEEKSDSVLDDEHGILWFISHCTWGSRIRAVVLLVPFLGAVFFAGFRLGAIESVRNLYMQWESALKAQPSASPTPAQPIK
jgi:hypothetical protein